jgi:hypothetical protein
MNKVPEQKKTSLKQFMETFLSLNFEKVYGHGVDNARDMKPIRKKNQIQKF